MIPDIMINQLINETHEECGHGGASKTYQLLRLDCQFRHMFKKIKRITQSCDICQIYSPRYTIKILGDH